MFSMDINIFARRICCTSLSKGKARALPTFFRNNKHPKNNNLIRLSSIMVAPTAIDQDQYECFLASHVSCVIFIFISTFPVGSKDPLQNMLMVS
jgi:hypothetical protein